MIVARWSIEARFGHKQTVIDLCKKWQKEIGVQIGWSADKSRLLTASIGTLESTIQSEMVLNDLAELNAAWEKLATVEAHRLWSKELEPYIVNGTNRWEIFRIVS